jgi:riboflavin kinase/FMN adenylyltransferase
MQLHYSLETIAYPDSWLSIGVFDGVHRGHQAIIKTMVRGAHEYGIPAVVLSFDPHPLSVLRPNYPLQMLSDLDERAAIFEKLGVDALIAHPFNHEVAALTAEEFLTRLKMRIGFTHFRVGHDFAMGHNREGDIPRLRLLGGRLGYTLQVIDPLTTGDIPVSSSRIRRTLLDGQVAEAADMLGRPYSLHGAVVEGAQRGRKIGIPTANLAVPEDRLIPAAGVYASRVRVAGKTYAAATNIGVRPTFDGAGAATTVEAHILNFQDDIYGQELGIKFIERLRGEQKFDGIDALVEQIRADIRKTREVLNEAVS